RAGIEFTGLGVEGLQLFPLLVCHLLKKNLKPELNLPSWCSRRRDLSCRRADAHSSVSVWDEQIRIRLSKIRVIQRVEDFCPELNSSRFTQLDVFDQREVCCKEARSRKRVAPDVPGSTHRLQAETRRIIPTFRVPEDRLAAGDDIRSRVLKKVPESGLV